MLNVRPLASLIATCCMASVIACSTPPARRPLPVRPSGCAAHQDFAACLRANTGVEWTIERYGRDVTFVAPLTPTPIGSTNPEEDVRRFVAQYATELGAAGVPDEIRLERAQAMPVPPMPMPAASNGFLALRFAHYLHGSNVPVLDAATVATFAGNRLVTLTLGFSEDLLQVSPTPSLSRSEAERRAIRKAKLECNMDRADIGQSAELGAVSRPKPALSYRVVVRGSSNACVDPIVTIDAHTGEASLSMGFMTAGPPR